ADDFGYTVSLDGDTMAIGAPYESSAASVINGDEFDDSASQAGAVYVFTRTDGVWSQEAYIKPFNMDAMDVFGASVSLDGDTLAVGSVYEASIFTGVNSGGEADNTDGLSGGGAAYVFVRDAGVWTQQAYIKASNTGDGDGFGAALQLDGDTLAVGAYLEDSRGVGVNGDEVDHPSGEDSGAVYVFKRTDASWVQEAYIKMDTIISPAQFGLSVALEADTLVAGADRTDVAAGLVVSFTRLGSVWTQEAVITPTLRGDNDQFGFSLDLFADTLAVGAVGEDSAALGVNTGGETDDSALNSGAVYVFTRAAGLWTQEAYIKASNVEADDVFGYHVSLEQNRLGVGAKGESSAATGYDGDESDNSVVSSGAVYLFSRSAGAWSQTSYLKASNTNSLDYFGFALSLSGADLAVGAYWEQSTATGIDGDQTDNSFSTGAGAVYVTQP
ncbi:integrin, partial [Myxococcota bacterium]|nr:integrin [Myxococcota bacterium]